MALVAAVDNCCEDQDRAVRNRTYDCTFRCFFVRSLGYTKHKIFSCATVGNQRLVQVLFFSNKKAVGSLPTAFPVIYSADLQTNLFHSAAVYPLSCAIY